MDKEVEISAKMMNECNENDLDVKFVSFEWTPAKGIMNAIRMNHHKMENVRFKVLKGIIIADTIQCGNELSCTK